MSLLPDPGQMYAAADRITRHADALRARAGRLVASAAHARWHSTAAGEFRRDVAEIGAQMRSAAGRVEGAADALRRHARRVEEEFSLLAAAERAVVHTEGTVVTGLVHGGEKVLDAIGVL